MAEKRQLELYLLRFLPHALRDDFITVGLLLVEGDGGFAEVRFTRDWRMLQCVAPDVELEWFARVESEIRGKLGNLQRREDLMQLVNERFGTMIDVAPTKAVLTDDPVKEMEVLTSMYLVPMERGERGQQRTGRVAIVNTMKEAFTNAGVLELLQRDLDVVKYTGQGDPFRIDFGYRVGSAVKMFHAASVAANVDQALALAYRYSRVEAGMRQEQLQASLTAVVDLGMTDLGMADQGMALQGERTRFAIGMLEQSSVRVRAVGETGRMKSPAPTIRWICNCAPIPAFGSRNARSMRACGAFPQTGSTADTWTATSISPDMIGLWRQSTCSSIIHSCSFFRLTLT